MTNQDLMQQHFDTVAKHLFAQGGRCVVGEGSSQRCLYRGPNGMKCAIGALIPDEHFDPNWDNEKENGDGMGADDVIKAIIDRKIPLEFAPNDTSYYPYKFYNDLQIIHDSASYWENTERMRAQLETVADRYNLSPTILDTLSFEGR